MFFKIPEPKKKVGRPRNTKKIKSWPKYTGATRIFKTPDDLWDVCCDYFKYVEENPLLEEKVYVTKKGLRVVNIKKKRAMTIRGMCVHIGITRVTFYNYAKHPDFKEITETICNIIYTQKFEGAAAGLLNGNLIARDLGLADKKEFSADVAVTKKNFNDFYSE